MTLYSIFDRRLDEAPAVVPDRFSWFAALLPPVFGMVHGLSLGLVLYVAGVVVIAVAGLYFGADTAFWLYVLFAALIGWEAPSLRRRALRRRGYIYRAERIAPADDVAQVDWIKRRGTPA
jgi:hypothetical protein